MTTRLPAFVLCIFACGLFAAASNGQSEGFQAVSRWSAEVDRPEFQNLIVKFDTRTESASDDWTAEKKLVRRLDNWWSYESETLRHWKGEHKFLNGVIFTDQCLIQSKDQISNETQMATGYTRRESNNGDEGLPAGLSPLAPWFDLMPARSARRWSKTMLEAPALLSSQRVNHPKTNKPVLRVKSQFPTFRLTCDFEIDGPAFPIRFEMHSLPGYISKQGGEPLGREEFSEFEEIESSKEMYPFPKIAHRKKWHSSVTQQSIAVANVLEITKSAGLTKSSFVPVLPIKDGTAVQANDFMHVPCEWRNGRIQPVDHSKSAFAEKQLFMSPGWWSRVFLWGAFFLLCALAILVFRKVKYGPK